MKQHCPLEEICYNYDWRESNKPCYHLDEDTNRCVCYGDVSRYILKSPAELYSNLREIFIEMQSEADCPFGLMNEPECPIERYAEECKEDSCALCKFDRAVIKIYEKE